MEAIRYSARMDAIALQWLSVSVDLADAAEKWKLAVRLWEAGRPELAEDAARRALEATERGVMQIPGWV